MADLTLAAAVTRAEMSLPDLTLNTPGVCKVVGYDPGGVTKVRGVAKSPSVVGGIQTFSKADLRTITLTLRVYAVSKAALDTATQDIFDAFDQSNYQLTVSVNGTAVTWQCNDADWTLQPDAGAAGVDMFALMASPLRQVWQFTIPAQPVPMTGVF